MAQKIKLKNPSERWLTADQHQDEGLIPLVAFVGRTIPQLSITDLVVIEMLQDLIKKLDELSDPRRLSVKGLVFYKISASHLANVISRMSYTWFKPKLATHSRRGLFVKSFNKLIEYGILEETYPTKSINSRAVRFNDRFLEEYEKAKKQ